MSFAEAIKLAVGSLRTNKLRSFLTLLGIIVGIASVITIMTIGRAFQVETQRSFSAYGLNDITVNIVERPAEGEAQANPDPFGMGYGYSMTPVDEKSRFTGESIEEIRNKMGSAIEGIPLQTWLSVDTVSSETGRMSMHEGSYVSVMGVNLDFLKLQDVKITYGRSLTQEDMDQQRRVAVISDDLLPSLFPGGAGEAIGEQIEVTSSEGRSDIATVVGIAQSPKADFFANSMGTSTVYLPYTAASRYSSVSNDSWDMISVRPAADRDVAQIRTQLQMVLDSMYAGNSEFMPDVRDYSNSAEAANAQLGMISMVISAIGGISLLVGGIGVMNIMLVAVTERTREIGIRKALGARRKDIRRQFVIEAMIICLAGGIIGVLVGGLIGMLVGKIFGPWVLPPIDAVLVALLFSLLIGNFFGFYPANKASKLTPVEALRYE